MSSTPQRLLAVAAVSALVVGACSGSAASPAASGGAGASAGASGPPYTATLKDGSSFTLAPRIADKLKNKQPINYVFSYQASGIALFSQQYAQGYQQGCDEGTKIYPLNCKSIAPVQTDVATQVSQIQALLDSNQIDCLSIEPASSDGFTAITNTAMSKGIPVFTVGVTSNGNEFTNFTQIPEKEGKKAADTVIQWMKDTKKDLKVFAVSGGDPTQFWAQGRMKGFVDEIKAQVPGATFLNDQTNGLNTSYDPATTYDKAKAFITANPTVQFIENVDIGAEHIDKAITDLGKVGQVFTIGWNVSYGQLDAIDAGIQVAALDQRWAEQAAFGGPACANFLATGKILPNTQELKPVLKADTAAARDDLKKILGQ